MCGTCGCDGPSPAAPRASEPPPPGLAAAAAPTRRIVLEQRLLAHNERHAAANRDRFREAGVRVVNLLSSPGAGKTALLEALARTRPELGLRPVRQAVLVGDLATDHDARRLIAAGLPALQINTGQGCHLEAAQVGRALDQLQAQGTALADLDRLWIENVGNLVCPAAFDLGETLRLVLMATTEGEDKPLKYAPMFRSADLVLISKSDLAEAVGFDRAAARAAISRVAPRAGVLEISARSGAGLAALCVALQEAFTRQEELTHRAPAPAAASPGP